MAWYKTPIRPIDPVTPADGTLEPIRYVRDNFTGTGQDSFTVPPTQDQSLWQQLINIMPIFDGTLNRRWGSQLWTASAVDQTGTYAAHMYSFQRTDGTRKIAVTYGGSTTYGCQLFNEDGTGQTTGFIRTAGNNPLRLIASRNYLYAYNGQGTAQKWDGTGNAITNWGINVNGVTGSVSQRFAGAVLAANGWGNANNAIGNNNGTTATFGLSGAGTTPFLALDQYSLSTSGTIQGIQATIYAGATATNLSPKTIRPSQSSASGTGQFLNPSNAWDGNLSTFATVNAEPINASQSQSETGTIFGFPSIGSPTPATLTLTVKVFGSNGADPGASGSGSSAYSLDGGNTWTNFFIFSTNGSGGGTYTIPLSPTQNTTLIQVRGVAFAHNGSNLTQALSNTSIQIYEAYVTATYGSGATSGILLAQLIKNGAAYGQVKTTPITIVANGIYNLGNASDLWQGSFIPGDINAANFGLQIAIQLNGGGTADIDAAQLTVSMAGGGPVITSTSTSGSVTLVAGRTYYVAAKNSSTGHYSDLSQASSSTGAITSKQIALTLPVFTDTQVDVKALLATADGNDPSILYEVVELPNATTTYNDNTPDTALVLNQVLLTTDDLGNEVGITNNDPPPAGGTLAIKHKGRLWMAVGQNLFFSKSVADLTLPNGFVAGKYEEAWPAVNYFDVSMGAENIRGLLTDGTSLYIGTERHIRILYGDTPDNFQVPEIIHQEVGLLNQDVWIPVYLEGAPSGAMWLTPDFRVIGSDFNTYRDLGHPIQDVLNSINPAAVSSAHAMFVSEGPFNLYILAIPTGTNTFCDTHCVFDMRTSQWFIFRPTDPSSAMLFNVNAQGIPQWLYATTFAASTNTVSIFQYTPSATTDRAAMNVTPVIFPVSATSSWLHFGMPTQRKPLNDIDIVGDANMTISVSGATTQADFQSPNIITSNQSLTFDPLGQVKLFLAGLNTRYRYYQITFSASGGETDFLDSYNVAVLPTPAL